MSTSASNNVVSSRIGLTIAFVAAPIVYYKLKKVFRKSHPLEKFRERKLKPPFPQEVRDMLSKCNLAYLSTVDAEVSSSHLSLMRFTYLLDKDDGEVVIMSTNKETKKFDMLQQQKGVALLVHDFSARPESGNYSITLNGTCRIVTAKEKEAFYRNEHLKRNPQYPQFIVGENIAILCVDVTSARICNINDQVVKWDIADGVQS